METKQLTHHASPFGPAQNALSAAPKTHAAALRSGNKENPSAPPEKGTTHGRKGGHRKTKSISQSVSIDENSCVPLKASGKDFGENSAALGQPGLLKTQKSLFADSTGSITNISHSSSQLDALEKTPEHKRPILPKQSEPSPECDFGIKSDGPAEDMAQNSAAPHLPAQETKNAQISNEQCDTLSLGSCSTPRPNDATEGDLKAAYERASAQATDANDTLREETKKALARFDAIREELQDAQFKNQLYRLADGESPADAPAAAAEETNTANCDDQKQQVNSRDELALR